VSQTLKRLLKENAPSAARDLVKPLLNVYSASRDCCGGDLDKFLVLLVIAMRTAEDQQYAQLRPEQLLSDELPVYPSLGTNVRSIAESTHIPKETVRRKVAELIEAGWIVRQRRQLFFTARAHRGVAPVTDAIESLAIRYFELISKLATQKRRD
jgi:DNA-binding transcriptional regulator YhcF (GntR family)